MEYQITEELEKLGEGVFIKKPLYKRKDNLKLMYVNKELFKKIFGDKDPKIILENYFSVTINDFYKKNEKVIGEAYIDKQADPTNISLDGNSGSGRAYYVGKDFNLKGELTPLATSKYPEYNNGKLSLESAIHETLISNVLSKEAEPKTYETLAMFDSNEKYVFPNSDYSMNCAVMIRYLNDNELYRLSHLFVNNKKLNRNDLKSLAIKMGILEGNKIIDRLLHGAWSLGNLSVEANMIDFDTSYFLQNRNHSYSFTYKYKTNYFNEEYLGELKMLEILINSGLNIDKVEFKDLEKILVDNMNDQIVKRFPFLMGLDNNVECSNLANKFIELSKYGYQNYDAINTMNPNNSNVAVFNFSNFFRYYPLLKQKGKYNIPSALSLLLNGEGFINPDSSFEELKIRIEEYISKYQIKDDKQYMYLLEEAIEFINEYDKSFPQENLDKAVMNAYIRNEDRDYLFNDSLTKYKLAALYNGKNNELINQLMNLIIECSIRKNVKDMHKCDLELFEDYAIYKVIDRKRQKFHLEVIALDKNIQDLDVRIDGIKSELIDDKCISESYSTNLLDEKFNIQISNKKIKRKVV